MGIDQSALLYFRTVCMGLRVRGAFGVRFAVLLSSFLVDVLLAFCLVFTIFCCSLHKRLPLSCGTDALVCTLAYSSFAHAHTHTDTHTHTHRHTHTHTHTYTQSEYLVATFNV